MAKYQGQYRLELDADDKSYSEELADGQKPAEDAAAEAEKKAEEAAGAKGDTWETRYGALRAHEQRKSAAYEEELKRVKAERDEALKSQLKLPATEDEVEEWKNKYPKVFDIVKSIAGMTTQEALEGKNSDFEDIKTVKTELAKEKAFNALLKLHPDWHKVVATKKFQEWANEQPEYIYDALYKNSTDAEAAARAMDLYKLESGAGTKKATAENEVDAAAEAVTTGGRREAPSGGRQIKFSESQVARMTPQEYEANEEAIEAAMRKGEFEYDLSA